MKTKNRKKQGFRQNLRRIDRFGFQSVYHLFLYLGIKLQRMEIIKHITTLIIGFFFGCTAIMNAQIHSGVYISDTDNMRRELKIDDRYMVYSEYRQSPPKFIRTLGGFSRVEAKGGRLVVLLEFNSTYEKDSLRMLSIP